ncbi:MAG: hypothetical protein ACJ0Q9_00095 [Gammaproteobacteria bacterium]
MALFDIFKSKEVREIEKRTKAFSDFLTIQTMTAILFSVSGLSEHQKITTAIFFDCAVTLLFNDLNDRTLEDKILGEYLIAHPQLGIESEHINKGRWLAQQQHDEKAVYVVGQAEKALLGLFSGEDTRTSLQELLSDDMLQWDDDFPMD